MKNGNRMILATKHQRKNTTACHISLKTLRFISQLLRQVPPYNVTERNEKDLTFINLFAIISVVFWVSARFLFKSQAGLLFWDMVYLRWPCLRPVLQDNIVKYDACFSEDRLVSCENYLWRGSFSKYTV